MDSKKNYKVFAIFINGTARLIRNFVLLPDRYIKIGDNEPTPIEDYGDWMLFENESITEEKAFDVFLSRLNND